MKKRLLSALIRALLGASCALAEEAEPKEFECLGYHYILREDGTVMITKYNEAAKNLNVPAMLNGRRVTGIENEAFFRCKGLDRVTIPESVIEVDGNPFWGCDELEDIRVSPDSPTLAVIDGVLFSKPDKRLVCCPCKLEKASYSIPDGIRIIDIGAFDNCERLADITIPDSVTVIGMDAFLCCTRIGTIKIPEGVTRIGMKAFFACENLTSVTLPDSLIEIDDYAFMYCDKLADITIPDNVVQIGSSAFWECESLTKIRIPDSVSQIGNNPFIQCSNLKKIRVSPDSSALAVIDGVLFSKKDKRLVCYPCGLKKNSYEIPKGIRIIGNSAFFFCDNITGITIPDSVTEIGSGAFWGCKGLTRITIPNSVTEIGNRAFYDCDNLTDITIPDSVTEIGEDVFKYCDNLTLTVERDSYAAQYARDNGVNYTYPDSWDWLNG